MKPVSSVHPFKYNTHTSQTPHLFRLSFVKKRLICPARKFKILPTVLLPDTGFSYPGAGRSSEGFCLVEIRSIQMTREPI